jgi:hypothetical protein
MPSEHSLSRRLRPTVSLICFALTASSNGQTIDAPRQPRSWEQQPPKIIASAGSNRLEWRGHYQFQTGLTVGTSDDKGTLWLITRGSPGKLEEFLTKINPEGNLVASYEPKVPLRPIESVAYLAPAASGKNVGLLASLSSGGRDQTFEGAFFFSVGPDGITSPVRIAHQGPQFPTMIAAEPDRFLVAGDQEPLTLMKLDSGGKVLWRRAFSSKLVLPVVSLGSEGLIFMLSQAGSHVLLQMLDPSGRVVRSKRLSAKQGHVTADPNGGCSVLLSRSLNAKNNPVYLISLDQNLGQLSEVTTPLEARGGRTYQVISTPRGHIVIGEGPEENQTDVASKKVIAEFDKSGGLIWQQSLSSIGTPLLVPFSSGFYLVREQFAGEGLDIEKYLY